MNDLYDFNDPANQHYLTGGMNDNTAGDNTDQGPGTDVTDLPAPVTADLTSDTDNTTSTNRNGQYSAPSQYDTQNMIDAANATAASAVGGNTPGDIKAQMGTSANEFLTAQDVQRMGLNQDDLGAAQRYADSVNRANAEKAAVIAGNPDLTAVLNGSNTKSLPNPGNNSPSTPTTPTASTGGGGNLSDAEWAADFQKAMGYYNPEFESRNAFLNEAEKGDQVIRGQSAGGPHIDELARMAQYDASAKAMLDAINNDPNFYESQNAANNAALHNASLAQQMQGLVGQGGGGSQGAFNTRLGAQGSPQASGQAALNWLRTQEVNVPTSPIDNAHALMTDQVRSGVVDALTALGAKDFKIGLDNYGNLTLDYTSKSGTPEKIGTSFVDMANALQTLKDRVAAMNAAATPPAANTGGGYPSRNYGGGRSYSPPRGYEPPAAPPQAPAPPSTPNNSDAAYEPTYKNNVIIPTQFPYANPPGVIRPY